MCIVFNNLKSPTFIKKKKKKYLDCKKYSDHVCKKDSGIEKKMKLFT